MENMLLSIIIPVYNVENYLNQCVDSIIKQIKENIEIILIDDGSTDNSFKICNDYTKLYKFIKSFNKKNTGLSDTRNYGLKKAQGKYVWFVDSDDYIADNVLTSILNKIKNTNYDIYLGDANIVNQNGEILDKISNNILSSKRIYNGLSLIKELLEKNKDYNTCVWLSIYRREFLLKNNLVFEYGIIHEDELWTPIVFSKANSICYINKIIYAYRIRKNSIMRSKNISNRIHVESYIYIYTKLFSYVEQNIKDKYALSLLKDNIAKKYLYSIARWKFYKYPQLYKKINKKQILKSSISLKNKFKSLILIINIHLYTNLFLFFRGGDNYEKNK